MVIAVTKFQLSYPGLLLIYILNYTVYTININSTNSSKHEMLRI